MEDLKPCPFCGGDAISGVQLCESAVSEITLQAIIKCKEGCASRITCFKAARVFQLVPFGDFIGAFNATVSKWNERAGDNE